VSGGHLPQTLRLARIKLIGDSGARFPLTAKSGSSCRSRGASAPAIPTPSPRQRNVNRLSFCSAWICLPAWSPSGRKFPSTTELNRCIALAGRMAVGGSPERGARRTEYPELWRQWKRLPEAPQYLIRAKPQRRVQVPPRHANISSMGSRLAGPEFSDRGTDPTFTSSPTAAPGDERDLLDGNYRH